jgi:2-C-methyl-D-erythritol 4-phosphate cytidylyltransferase
VPVVCVAGGAERTDSVRRGLDALPSVPFDCILVHDAARPFVPAVVISRVVEAVLAGADAVIPVLPVTDTIKRVGPDGQVTGTPDRSGLVAVQTPQGFRPAVLRRAYDVFADIATDDASLVERLGLPVDTVEGSPDAFKITRPADLVLAEALLSRRSLA